MTQWRFSTVTAWLGKSITGQKKLFAIPVLVLVFAVIMLGWYWSSEPDHFDVADAAAIKAQDSGRNVVVGYTTVMTLHQVASTMLDKPGGFITNDMMPPGVWLDNISSWEMGVLIQVRDLARAMRKDFSRSQSQSTEDEDLSSAEPKFHFDNSSWMFPASESEYRDALQYLGQYGDKLSDPLQPSAQFYARADNLNAWLSDVETRLGSLSQQLSASVGQVRVNTNLAGDVGAKQSTGQANQEKIRTPWLEIDDVFYEARGTAWALSHFLKAIEVDFKGVLEKKNATASLQQIIRELDETQLAVWSPIILNGTGFGLLANHSLVMANYISRANAAINDMRQLLEKG